MQLLPGFELEYERRHRDLWPELEALLKAKGISNYAIFLERESGKLFACLQVADEDRLAELPAEQVMQQWWAYMSDIMITHEDQSPLARPLQEVFYLP